MSGQKLKSGFEKMMRENSAVVNAAFPQDQISMMRQFARVADLANNTTRNNSNSGIVNVTNLRNLGQKLAMMFQLKGPNFQQFLMQLPFMEAGGRVRASARVPSSSGYQGSPQRTGPILPSATTALLNENLNDDQRAIAQ